MIGARPLERTLITLGLRGTIFKHPCCEEITRSVIGTNCHDHIRELCKFRSYTRMVGPLFRGGSRMASLTIRYDNSGTKKEFGAEWL